MQLQLIAWGLRRRPWRNVLIMSSVALTVAVMTVFFSTQLELSKFFDRLDAVPYQRLWVRSRNISAREMHPLAMRDLLSKVPGVVKVLYAFTVNTRTPDDKPFHIQGCADGQLEIERDFFPVDDATIQQWNSDPTGAVLGEMVADALHARIGELAELPTASGPLKVKVAGISRGGPFAQRVVVHYKLLDEHFGAKAVVSDYRIVLDKKTDSRPVVKAVDDILHSRGSSSHLVGERTMMEFRGAGSAGLIPRLLGALGIVLLLTTAMAITNTAVISVRERRAELATLRVLGFKKRTIVTMIVSEIFLVCMAGAVLGSVAAWFVMRDGLALGSNLLMSVHMTLPGVIAGVGSCFVVAIAGSSLSSWLAIRAPLATALRDS